MFQQNTNILWNQQQIQESKGKNKHNPYQKNNVKFPIHSYAKIYIYIFTLT